MGRSLLWSIILTILLLGAGNQYALAHPRLDPERPSVAGYIYCMDGQEGNIHLYLCASRPIDIPSTRVILTILEELTDIYNLEEVFKVDVLILPPNSFMKDKMRGIYNLMTGTILVRGTEPDQYRLGYVMAHEIAHAILDQVLKVHGLEHHPRLVCQDELASIKAQLDTLARQTLRYDNPKILKMLCSSEGEQVKP